LAPQVRFELTRLRATRYGAVSPKLAVSFGERAEADNPPVNRRGETSIWNNQTLSLLRAIDLKGSLSIPCHGRKNPN